ncbi:hypothetical protein Tco_0007566 [Tanacetum coccineum]
MNTTKEQQKELDDALVAPKNHLKIGKSNLRLSSNLKSKEPTLQILTQNLPLNSPGQKFEEPPLEEDIISSIRILGHSSEIKLGFQVENKNSKKNNDMYYPCFTKVIVGYFMAKDQAIPRRNMMFWHYARDDFMFTTIRVISKH